MFSFLIAAFGLLLFAGNVSAQYWPKEISGSMGKIILYEPQPDKFEHNILTGISAFSITPMGKKEPIFGTLFFEGKLMIDRVSRTYTMQTLSVADIKISDQGIGVDPDSLKALLTTQAKRGNLIGSIDELIGSLEVNAKSADMGTEDFKHDPPLIIISRVPAVLISIDGEPILRAIPESSLKRVVNSAFIIIQNTADNTFYLFGGDFWFSSSDIHRGWTLTTTIPAEIAKLMGEYMRHAEKAPKVKPPAIDSIPQVIIATEPAELIQTDGVPEFIPIRGTSLLYAKNSDDNIFKDINSKNFFILKSGRWFASKKLEEGWRYVDPFNIPLDFSRIPEGNEKDIVLSFVPGTIEAHDAILDTKIPQMATIDRKSAGKELQVEYDGEPIFGPINGTSLQLAENANKTVMISGGKYYVVDNGVWYESDNYHGPWEVAITRPADVDHIPASSSAYNTRFVKVYDYTPDLVVVGYTPGYTGSYVVGSTVVYGTGWHYEPWIGHMFFPRPVTWGFNMGFNPWMGWGMYWGMRHFHFGFRSGWDGLNWSMGQGSGGGWFGPPMYRPPMIWGHPRGWYGQNRPGGWGNQKPPEQPFPPISSKSTTNIQGGSYQGISNNLYTNPGLNRGVLPAVQNNGENNANLNNKLPAPDISRTTTPASKPEYRVPVASHTITHKPLAMPGSRIPNTVYSDRDGNVYQRINNGQWQQRNNNSWTRPEINTDRTLQLNSMDRYRTHSTQRVDEYQRISSQSHSSQSGPSQKARGGVGSQPSGRK